LKINYLNYRVRRMCRDLYQFPVTKGKTLVKYHGTYYWQYFD